MVSVDVKASQATSKQNDGKAEAAYLFDVFLNIYVCYSEPVTHRSFYKQARAECGMY